MTGWLLAPASPRPAAVLRILLGVVFLYDAAVRWPYAVELYSSAGLPMPAFPAWQYAEQALVPPIPGPALAVSLHSLLIFAWAAVALGWWTRCSLLLALVLSLWLGLLDQTGTFKKYSVLGAHAMLLLAFTRSGAWWSLDRFWSKERDAAARLSPVWPLRLLQLLAINIYFQSALLKLRLPDFLDGELLMFSLLDDAWGGGAWGKWLATRPRLLSWASWAAVAVEVIVPALIWIPRTRRAALLLAVAFHLALAALMQLGIFSFAMLALLSAFLTEADLQALARFREALLRRIRRPIWRLLARRPRRQPPVGTSGSVPAAALPDRTSRRREKWRALAAGRPRISLGLYLLAACVSVGVDVAVQRAADWYGVFGRKRLSSPAVEINDPRLAGRIFAARPMEPRDAVHRLDLGSRLSRSGTLALGESRTFRRGMVVHAVARLIGGATQRLATWQLIRPDGASFEQSHRLEAGVTHASIGFQLTGDLPAGIYRVLLHLDGQPAAERAFEITGDAPEPRTQ